MTVVGKVDSLWRYPVKSMHGEEVPEIFVGFSGVFGDRLFAFKNTVAPVGFPYLTGRETHAMLTYRPRFRHPDKTAAPANASEAQKLAPGLNPVPADADDLALDVETPDGKVLPIDDAALLRLLRRSDQDVLTLLRSDKAITDCRPVSLLSLQTARQLADEVGIALDKRRFRANIYLDLDDASGFAEDSFVGRRVRIGSQVEIWVLERDPRCQMITLDPDTGAPSPVILRNVAQAHDGKAGVYGAVLAEGTIRQGDTIELLN